MPSSPFPGSDVFDDGVRFCGTPRPLFCESFGSWVQRVCQHFQLTYTSFYRLTRIDVRRDTDLALDPVKCRKLAHLFALAEDDFSCMRLMFQRCSTWKSARGFLNFTDDGKPAYRFCPCCLRTDATPYYRLEWRFKHWTVCPRHRVKMEDACQSCGSAPQMSKTMLSGYRGVPSLAYCYACWGDVGRTPAPAGSEGCPEIDRAAATARAVVSAVILGCFGIVGFNSNWMMLKHLPGLLGHDLLVGAPYEPLPLRRDAFGRPLRTPGHFMVPVVARRRRSSARTASRMASRLSAGAA